jgi:hypothetical protein
MIVTGLVEVADAHQIDRTVLHLATNHAACSLLYDRDQQLYVLLHESLSSYSLVWVPTPVVAAHV